MKTTIMSPEDVTPALSEKMFDLMQQYYDNLKKTKFLEDLARKDRVILLFEGEELCGFSSMEWMDITVEDRTLRGIFSGDTIVRQEAAFSLALQKAFIQEVLNMPKDRELYWFLISKGYKTYRYLPLFFKEFYPHPEKATPAFEQQVMDSYALKKYPAYDAARGVIPNQGENDYVKAGVADVDQRLLKKKEVAFFVEKNPGYLRGDELVCLASFARKNLKPFFFKLGGTPCTD